MKNINNNKGFSLLELLIVMAVSAVVVGFASLSISTYYNAKVNDAAARMESMIRRARTESMSKGQEAGKLILTVEGDGLYGQIGTTGGKELISSNLIDVYITNHIYGTADNVYNTHNMLNAATGTYEIEFTSSGLVQSESAPGCPGSIIFSRGSRHWQVLLFHETGHCQSMAF